MVRSSDWGHRKASGSVWVGGRGRGAGEKTHAMEEGRMNGFAKAGDKADGDGVGEVVPGRGRMVSTLEKRTGGS